MNVDPRILPTILTVIDVLAAIAYAVHGGAAEWRMFFYWMSAAVLTFVVTW